MTMPFFVNPADHTEAILMTECPARCVSLYLSVWGGRMACSLHIDGGPCSPHLWERIKFFVRTLTSPKLWEPYPIDFITYDATRKSLLAWLREMRPLVESRKDEEQFSVLSASEGVELLLDERVEMEPAGMSVRFLAPEDRTSWNEVGFWRRHRIVWGWRSVFRVRRVNEWGFQELHLEDLDNLIRCIERMIGGGEDATG